MYKAKSKTIVETAIIEVQGFDDRCSKLKKSFAINGKAQSTLNNYTRCLTH